MRDKLIELISQMQDCGEKETDFTTHIRTNERLADYLIANGVIVPPCKIGQEVWYLTNACDGCKSMDDWCHKGCKKPTGMTKIASGIVHKFDISGNGFNYIETYGKDDYYHDHSFRFDSIGKTVFLTEKEAKRALAEERKKNEIT